MTATQIIREALEIYARSTIGPDRHIAEQLALQASEMARATFYGADDDNAVWEADMRARLGDYGD